MKKFIPIVIQKKGFFNRFRCRFALIFILIGMHPIYPSINSMKQTHLSNIEHLIEGKILEKSVQLFRKTFHDFEKRNEVAFQTKSDGSLVSNLELEIETVIGSFLKEETPWAGFQGEEGVCYDAAIGENEYRWYLDPIDGTTSFHNQWDTFAFTLTLVNKSEALATVIDFPRLSRTYIAYLGQGAFLNQKAITLESAVRSEKPILAVSDQYTFEMTQRGTVLDKLRSLPYIARTVTDIYGYCMVAEGKCVAKFDAAGALWDLWPGYLLIREAGGKCLFFPLPDQSEDLAGSMLVGHPDTIDIIYSALRESIDKAILPDFHEKPSIKGP